ncbi:hypothetical protein LNK15_15400, partial [Jeotgalicoccus huakuii]|nr:hypothetical protein [Jeotgalicoccus huakuii]
HPAQPAGCRPQLARARTSGRPASGSGCMNRYVARGLLAVAALLLLALVWWGWHKGGMALMQLGMSVC